MAAYTNQEICTLYRNGAEISIIKDLTLKNENEILKILEEGGYLVADIERLKELHAEGLTIRAIGEELAIGQSTVNYHMKKLGLEPNGKGRKKKEGSKVDEVKKETIEKLKEETKENVEELKSVLPAQTIVPNDLPIDYEVVDDALTTQQIYELTKLTLEILKLVWEG